MKICLITIGSEVLSGKILDSNFAYIAARLSAEGYEITSHLCFPDERNIMLKGIEEAFLEHDLTIITGGLGATLDDLTKDILTEIFHDHLVLNQELHDHLETRYGVKHPALLGQAEVPSKAILLNNILGTAPGFAFYDRQRLLIAMPGVPQEMYLMFDEKAMRLIRQHFQTHASLTESLHFCHIHEYMVDPYLRELDLLYPDVEKGIYPRYGTLSVEFKTKANRDHAKEEISACVHKIEEVFKLFLFSKKDKNIALALHELLQEKHVTLMLAESCTGGQAASKLTQFSGASQYFLGSIVAYHDAIKTKLLHVKNFTLNQFGAVSREVAAEMALGALELSQADYAAAITGIAGPTGGSDKKPVGTVYFSLVKRDHPPISSQILIKAHLKREAVIDYSSNYILGALWRYIRHGTFESE